MSHNIPDPISPAVILVDPQMGENIGAAARAMLNCGLSDLRLVRPRDGWPNPAAAAMSSGALEKMPPVPVYDRLEDALAGIHFALATTARSRDMNKPVFTARQAAAEISNLAAQEQICALVFGAERTGLTNDDVSLCHGVITIPVNPDFSSLNLGQAVLLCAYEWFQAAGTRMPASPAATGDMPAPYEKMDELFRRLESELEANHFFRNPDQRPSMTRNLRNMLNRARMSEQETRTFHGMISALTGKKSEGFKDN